MGDTEPFSPSLFLKLPPTPTQPLPPDHLGLDFISRMLMEEDIHDDFFRQYPDHPAILSAQHPFEQIVSGYPSSDDDDTVAPASPTWTYDPIELLRSPPCTAGYFEQDKRKDPFAATHRKSSQDVLVSAFFDDQTDSDMAMLNMAFRKGMEEANKFLRVRISHKYIGPPLLSGPSDSRKVAWSKSEDTFSFKPSAYFRINP